MCRDLKRKSVLADVLRFGHESAVHLLDLYEDEEDLHNVLDPPPVALFSAKHQWSAPRPITLNRTPTQGFGFSVRGDAPVVIAGVDRNSLAEVLYISK
ncbi:hypothetical protein E2C01_089121 [Portunus trituberculatus]|uniref:Uncharacterized protein n=1 Tax=Portunus trituberculatus TaxID=210409 RepID=A0A5B7JHX2_PORTR|nr:hypothetical protein [Portunus trituberculatus]